MPTPSPFFARIKRDVIAILDCVPPGRLVTFQDVGAHLDVVPRHVAYILAMLDPLEQGAVPWHRAVAKDGVLSLPKYDAEGRTQRALLEAEGHLIAPDGRILSFGHAAIDVAELAHGVPRQQRPADAPRAPPQRKPRG